MNVTVNNSPEIETITGIMANIKIDKSSNTTSTNKCDKCRKKLTPAGRITCKCGNTFCAEHRYPFVHDCKYDDRKESLDRLAKENPAVVGKKIDKI